MQKAKPKGGEMHDATRIQFNIPRVCLHLPKDAINYLPLVYICTFRMDAFAGWMRFRWKRKVKIFNTLNWPRLYDQRKSQLFTYRTHTKLNKHTGSVWFYLILIINDVTHIFMGCIEAGTLVNLAKHCVACNQLQNSVWKVVNPRLNPMCMCVCTKNKNISMSTVGLTHQHSCSS